ncbi:MULTISPECIES: efflux RND transporter periplasmic adaptor subunit [unclassified Duganella]|uniref:efflux RND transporter periplasmic adaptor subunit n=1 Tax=unclassified Duganella TaxID=2636909 RepID=UPI001314F9F9|nr:MULTISPECIES: efflux RND transporter periplasmic adaptor subunit [unclassified Duganella]
MPAALLLAAGIALAYSLRTQSPAAAPAKKIPLVAVTAARQQELPLELSAQGHLVALNIVEVRPQLTATIVAIHFKEGDEVKAGQLLFTLDSADANAQLQRSEAQAAQILAQLADASRDFGRSSELVKSHFITSSAVDTAASKVDALKAQLKAARADIDSARLLVAHTRIVAPIAARTGAVAVHPGSLAQTSAAAPLVTLAQFSPIGVEFNLPEQDLTAILRARGAGSVRVTIDGADGETVTGELSFINNTVNTDSGTISLKATMPNPRATLWPGAYARVTVLAGIDRNAVVLPPQAVLEGPAGRFVFVAGADGKATRQPVTLLRVQSGMAVVEGVANGTRVVLEGGGNLRSGDAIRIADARPASAVAKAAP